MIFSSSLKSFLDYIKGLHFAPVTGMVSLLRTLTNRQPSVLQEDSSTASVNQTGPAYLKHEHGQLLVVLPLFHGGFHLSRRSGQRRPTALAGRLPVKLCHLLQLLPQVFSNYLSPFCRSQIKPVRHCSTKPNNRGRFIFIHRLNAQ